ncbi:hypothetical protein BJ742DRAFT_777642 [Cladochytrium replicatum]|nr:hypothetical protein BJ742DRAFT_777642 [Cladochytrium replicatum]
MTPPPQSDRHSTVFGRAYVASKIPVLKRSPPGSPPLSPPPSSDSTSPKLLKVSPNSRIPILHNRVRELRADNNKPLEIRGTPSTPVLRLTVLRCRLFSPNTMAKISTQRPRAA